MMLSALKGVGVAELQRELGALDSAHPAIGNRGTSGSNNPSGD